jgi:hypothetical protein
MKRSDNKVMTRGTIIEGVEKSGENSKFWKLNIEKN